MKVGSARHLESLNRQRGRPSKVYCHLVFGILALTVDQLMRLPLQARHPHPSGTVSTHTRTKAGPTLLCLLPTTARSVARILDGIAVPTRWSRPNHLVRHPNAMLRYEFCKRISRQNKRNPHTSNKLCAASNISRIA